MPGLVARELAGRSAAATAGERRLQQLGLTGARGEAESGFATVPSRLAPGGTAASCIDLLPAPDGGESDSNLARAAVFTGWICTELVRKTPLANGLGSSALYFRRIRY